MAKGSRRTTEFGGTDVAVTFPQWLYHGTTADCLPGFMAELINPQFWKPGKDFGPGFYTTIDLPQAKEWALKWGSENMEDPCVLEIVLNLESIPESKSHDIFLGPSREWAKFILDHRTMKEEDPCTGLYAREHAQIVTGPMADGNTGRIVDVFTKTGDKDVDWFYEQIMIDKNKNSMSGLALGNQISFHDVQSARQMLRLHGAWILNSEEEWIYYDNRTLEDRFR